MATSTQSQGVAHQKATLESLFLSAWYERKLWVWLLLPLALLYWGISSFRRWYLTAFRQTRLDVPVVVVGNITLGGTGKTPFLIELVKRLQAAGFNPGVISRGYGGRPPTSPYVLDETTTANLSGDEPLTIYKRTGAEVCVSRDRVAAGRALIERGCDILLSDDGLQQYRLGRDIEIVLIDGQRRLGNRMCIPVGPLREFPSRLNRVDFILLNSPTVECVNEFQQIPSHIMNIKPARFVQINSQMSISLAHFKDQEVMAVAGIGNPSRFKSTLNTLGIKSELRVFGDHHDFTLSDFEADVAVPVVMTEKDAVKCESFARDNWYYLEVDAAIDEDFWASLQSKINSLVTKKARVC